MAAEERRDFLAVTTPSGGRIPPVAGRGVGLALLATVLWCTSGLFVDPLVTIYRLAPVQLSFWRALLVAASLGPLLAWRDPPSVRLARREVPYYLIYGLVGVGLFNVVWSISVQVNKASVATALVYSAPAFVALGAGLIFRERLSGAQAGAVALDALGCALVSGLANPAALISSPAGLGWGLASGAIFAGYTLFGRRAGLRGRSSPSILFHTFAIAALGLGVWGLATKGTALLRPPLDAHGWLLLLGLTYGPTLGGYACFTACLRVMPAAVASLFTTLEPPLTAILALVLLGRVMTAAQWAGLALIVGAVLVMQAGAARSIGRQPRAED
jgi:drug/metabolite transporter (DMT)-like permease